MKRKILLIILLTVLCVSNVVCLVAFADEEQTTTMAIANLDQTDVLADLMTGETFDVTQYQWSQDSDDHPVLISFVEYCYSAILNLQKYYGLYVYVFNPRGSVLMQEGHEISIATAYSTADDTGGSKPIEYDTFELTLVDTSDNLADKNTKNMFWKFKVVDKAGKDGLTLQQRANPMERRYDVVGIQLVGAFDDEGVDVIPKDFQIGCSYKYSGFANGMALTNDQPIVCKQEHLDTITLDVQSTYYRTDTSNKGNGWQNDVNSVYFSVDKDYFNNYGTLKRIKAEWYEFVTSDIVVTSNNAFYTEMLPNLGKKYFDLTNMQYGLACGLENNAIPNVGLVNCAQYFGNVSSQNGIYSKLYYLFNTSAIQSYDSNKGLLEQGGIRAETLGSYIENFVTNNPSIAGDTFAINGKTYSKALFATDISDSRKISNSMGVVQSGFDGKSTYDFDVDVEHLNYETWDWNNGSYWDNVSMMDGDNWAWWHALWGNFPEQEEELQDIKYIVMVDESDLSLSKTDFCKKYLINTYDYDSFISYCRQEFYAEREVVLFRFAVTDYYSEMATVIKNTSLGFTPYEDEAYRAFGSVFLDFDIIKLTFKDKGGNYHAIGVVADPINIYPDVTPPIEIESPSLDMKWAQFLQLIFSGAIILALLIEASITARIVFR